MTKAALLKRLRSTCLALPEVVETVKWGHPTFVAGRKMFAVLDQYGGRPCIAFRASSPRRQAELVRDRRFYPAPYSAGYGWVCLHADQGLDWPEVVELLRESYRTVARKRMLAAIRPAPGVRTRSRAGRRSA